MQVLARHHHGAAVGLQQADEVFQQHALAGAAAADDGEHFARHDVEVHAAQHDLSAEALVQPLGADDRMVRGRRRGGRHSSTVLRT